MPLFFGPFFTSRESDSDSRQFVDCDEGSKNNVCPGVTDKTFNGKFVLGLLTLSVNCIVIQDNSNMVMKAVKGIIVLEWVTRFFLLM